MTLDFQQPVRLAIDALHREEDFAIILMRGAVLIVLAIPLALIIFLGAKAVALFTVDHVALSTFLFSPVFDPDNGRPGAAAFAVGTLAVTGCAVGLGGSVGLASAIFVAEIAPPNIAVFFRAVTEVLAGVPSVVFGWLGLTLIVPLVRLGSGTAGFGIFSAALVLSLMIFPTFVALCVDALRRVPRSLRESSIALGATRWETIARVVLPSAKNGLAAAVILSAARAVGETLAVAMVVGNAGVIPHDAFHAAATLPTEIVTDMSGALPGSLLEHALYAMAFLLLLISMFFIAVMRLLIARRVVR